MSLIINPSSPNMLIFSLENFERQEEWHLGAKITHGDQISEAVRALGLKVIVSQVDSWPGQFVPANYSAGF